MHSKLESKLKKIDMKINKELEQKLANCLPSSFDRTCYVQAYNPNSKKWYKARILDCRLSKDFDSSKLKESSSYDYYVHYQNLDRRNDDWLSYDCIKETTEKIEEGNTDDSSHNNQKEAEGVHINDNQHLGMSHKELLLHQEYTKFKLVPRIQIGKYLSDAWYYSPLPPYYHNIDCLYICEFCLSFFILKSELKRHSERCQLYHPPGNEIYRDTEYNVAVFEVDGMKNQVYCENLAFISKLFLDHKNLVDDMSIFLFYVLCEIEEGEYHIAGYFSKVKETDNNLSCILVFPFHQRKGYGKFLITFSYQLSLQEHKIGGPQKPLSDLGNKIYLSWWTQRIIEYIREHPTGVFNLQEMSKHTAMSEIDIRWAMQKVKMIKYSGNVAFLCTDEKYLEDMYKSIARPGLRVLKENIHFVPFKTKWDNPTLFL